MDTIKPNLASQLADFKAAFKQREAPQRLATMEAATADLKASGIEADYRERAEPAAVLAAVEQARDSALI